MDKNEAHAPKVLIVDNEDFIVEELVELFEANGMECIGCVSATDALRQFHADERIGLVLSDYRMPEMHGIQLIKLLKESARGRVFETILFTGDADKEDVIAALRAGVSDYYQKPLDLDALLEGVRRLQQPVQRRMTSRKIDAISDRIGELADSLLALKEGVEQMRHQNPEERAATQSVQVPGLASLSPRQLEVAQLIARGMTNYQISCELGISENTVKLYVSQVLRATNMHNRTMLALAMGGRR